MRGEISTKDALLTLFTPLVVGLGLPIVALAPSDTKVFEALVGVICPVATWLAFKKLSWVLSERALSILTDTKWGVAALILLWSAVSTTMACLINRLFS